MPKFQAENWRDRLPAPPNQIAGIKNPYSPGRMDWLRRLAHSTKPVRRIRSVVPGDCIRLGWTDYWVIGPDRAHGPLSEMKAKYPGKKLVETMAHTITPAGRLALAAWDAIEHE